MKILQLMQSRKIFFMSYIRFEFDCFILCHIGSYSSTLIIETLKLKRVFMYESINDACKGEVCSSMKPFLRTLVPTSVSKCNFLVEPSCLIHEV